MQNLYILLHRYGPEWDAQTLVFIQDKQVFDWITQQDSKDIHSWEYSELPQFIRDKYESLVADGTYSNEPRAEDFGVWELIEMYEHLEPIGCQIAGIGEITNMW